MATVKERVSYIVSWCQARKMPSETCIALLCNIRAESGANFNPQAIEVGSGAPPFSRSAQGYGLFQFSNFPTNQQIYNRCRNMSDRDAINYQLQFFYDDAKDGGWFNNANYTSTNLSFSDWVRNRLNWNASNLTFAMMRCWERPYNQTQNRYTMFIEEIRDLFNFATYDSNGSTNVDGSTTTILPANYDCGGAPITSTPSPTNPSDPRPPSDNEVSGIESALKMIEDRFPNKPWMNSAGYQCVALMQAYLNKFTFRDGFLPSAKAYGNSAKNSLSDGKGTWMGLSSSKWMIASKPIKRGDVLFYNWGTWGHVRIAYSSTKAYGQNEDGSGWTKRIWKTDVGNPSVILRKFR